MVAINIEPTGKNAEGKEVIRAFIVADKTPATLPETGENVKGMNAEQVFAPFSILYVTADVDTKVYITDEHGVFVAQ